MKLFSHSSPDTLSDSDLVSRTLSGHRDAFAAIVGRYQSLVCSVAYSATGNLGRSEDVAQDTFVAAWKQLSGLREPAKLRPWLCGIARNLVNNSNRVEHSQPTHAAASLEDIPDVPSADPLPSDHAVSADEAELLWHALEGIPVLYREPLVLFYRRHRSVEEVAAALELSVDAVRQRLTRGRQMLHAEIASMVERTLVRSAPSAAFTGAVMAALPLAAIGGSVAGAGAAAKGGAVAKIAMAIGGAGIWLGPLIGVFNGYLGYRAGALLAGKEERRALRWFMIRAMAPFLMFTLVVFAAAAWIVKTPHIDAFRFAAFIVLAAVICIAWYGAECLRIRRLLVGIAAKANLPARPPLMEFRSRGSLFGLPLVHVRLGGFETRRQPAVRAWIAVGDSAQGGLFAFGAVAIAPVALGGLSLGIISVGGMAVGAWALGGIALGGGAMGGVAFGWLSTGGVALGLRAATGGIAIARLYAQGGSAHAAHANDAAAAAYVAGSGFFQGILAFARPFIVALSILSCVFSAWIYGRARKSARGRR